MERLSYIALSVRRHNLYWLNVLLFKSNIGKIDLQHCALYYHVDNKSIG